jgi:hypothetical protein
MKNSLGRLCRFLLFPALFLLCGPDCFLHAQDTRDARDSGGGFFYIEKSGGRLRFIHHISWEKQDHAYR